MNCVLSVLRGLACFVELVGGAQHSHADRSFHCTAGLVSVNEHVSARTAGPSSAGSPLARNGHRALGPRPCASTTLASPRTPPRCSGRPPRPSQSDTSARSGRRPIRGQRSMETRNP
ncbi:hypothetical protein P7K49_005148 [Saguinus oedipus]|uniref:Secreted protein n=1 Tax=Saguinus oedipus TaxID=9490 RepID=A0ABQ9W9H1_SAGOE|nr:hypothetical protein P7K49_005148 [Saguinus oedipus]